MYNTIDCTTFGDIPWSSFSLQYNSEKPTDSVLAWMDTSYEICYRDPRAVIHRMLANPDFKDYTDYVPYCEYDPKTLEQCWQYFMSGDWAWQQAVSHFISISFQLTIHLYNIWQDEIAKDMSMHGSTFVPVILSSDKMVVSVATGHTEYWLLYLSIGNVCNSLHWSHKGAVTVIGFLAIPMSLYLLTLSLSFLAEI